MGKVLGIVYRTIATHQLRRTGYTRRTASTGAVILIQRFGSALNLNMHFHMLYLDGVYVGGRDHLRFSAGEGCCGLIAVIEWPLCLDYGYTAPPCAGFL